MTKREIAHQTGVSEATLQRWKSGASFPELPNIEKLSEVLKVSPIEFYLAEPIVAATDPVSIFAKKVLSIPDEIYEMAQDFSSSDSVWKQVKIVMKAAQRRAAAAAQKNSKTAG